MGMMTRAPMQVVSGDLQEAKLYRAIYSNRQLEEVLADFWFNHFNVYEGKGQPDRVLLASYERDAIRPHVLGKFKDLLLAVARHPAMLYYLDNWESMSPDVFQIGPFAPGPFAGVQQLARQSHGLNENYGRELLELHTLGVNGGYTQQDVIAVARCFTGWTIRQPNQNPEFVYAAFMHDTGEKTVLGHKIAAGGEEGDGLEAIDILAHHPSTARFISTRLARRFVADDPPPALIDAMARTFTKTDGDLRAVLETMFTSREFFSKGAWQSKIKSPLEMVVSAVRALDADALDTFMLEQSVTDMGEPLYLKEAPTGYKDGADTWLSTANVMARIRFAEVLVEGKILGVKVDVSRFAGKSRAEIARELLGREPSAQTMTALEKGMEGMDLGTDCKPCHQLTRISDGGNRYADKTNFSAWLGHGNGRRRLGSFLARTRCRIHWRQAQSPGCDLSARRGGWIECRGAVRGEALLRTAPHHRHRRAGQSGSREQRHRSRWAVRSAPLAATA